MQLITFYKYQGTGNDFVMIDGRTQEIKLNSEQIHNICNRRFGIGADGVIILKNHPKLDFEMDYYNADGSQSMCGNGGRCAVQFAKHMGILKNEFHFLAIDGEHIATIEDSGWVHLKMKDVYSIKSINNDYELNTGSPHYIKLVANLDNINVVEEGRAIRNSEAYEQEGINVNFVQTINDTSIFVRTYERGVEDETFSCGTGVTAASLVSAHNDRGFNRIEVETLGGKLAVEFDRINEEAFNNIWLCGPATFVFKGEKTLA
ncbi:MAG TPA: diaminopimelate epimerase [Arachidicoccus soli]|uniref:Diaminopimelate epimerase n=1 Tax=Arachidicoccus soli TaxID=2341117 RepID=A0A386HMF6_9BACT|nr:diaminopimelate epimerase [Arachidicoccus soli]AYD46923.1 diaminopimelate epimerase [Arachidicoccus soli]HEU0226434.1 diaminopimelate epimerase [Arachidicoccus soli]